MGAIWEEDLWRREEGWGGVYNCILMGGRGCKLPGGVSVLRLIVTMLLVHIHSDISIAAVSPSEFVQWPDRDHFKTEM